MQRRWISRRMVTIVGVTMTAWALPAWATPASASAEPVPLPGNAAGSQAYGLVADACPSAGNCAAGGYYTDSGLQHQGLLLSESGGSWTASELTFAAGSNGTSASDPHVTSVACASAGNCVAAGYYIDSTNEPQGFVVSESGGTWGKAIDATGPSPSYLINAPELVPEASCVPHAGCYAIFNRWSGSGYDNLVYASAGGPWTTTHIAAPGGGGDVELSSLSCPPGGSCAIVGTYADAGSNIQGLLATQGGSTVATLDTSSLPSVAANPVATPQAVDCPAAGDCTAVGYYEDNAGAYHGLLVSSKGGSWGAAVEAKLPDNAYAQGLDLSLNGVSCASAGNCEVVGTYDSSPTDTIDGLLLDESGGQWGAASEIGLPGAAWAAQPGVFTPAIACPAGGGCLAAGVYQNASNNSEGMLLSQSAGGWTPTAIGFANGATDPSDNSDPTSLACAASGYCVLAGGYVESTSGAGVLLTAPGSPGAPTATPGVDHASVTWTAPADNGGLPVTAYRIIANDVSAPSRGGQVVNLGTSNAAVKLPTLTVGDNYTFSVAAINQLGMGLSQTSNSVAILPSGSQLSGSLAALLRPSGPKGRLTTTRRAGSYTFTFNSLEAGLLTLAWYGHYASGHGRQRKQHTVQIGTASKSVSPGSTKITVRLTATGKRLLKTARQLKVTSQLSFTGTGQTATRKSANFTLH